MSETLRWQPHTESHHQIVTPEEVAPDMRIGVFSLWKPTPRRLRAAQAVAASLFSYGREKGESRFAAGSRGWKFVTPHGLLPEWQGVVEKVGDKGVWVTVAAHREDGAASMERMNGSLKNLPRVATPVRMYASFETMGLVTISQINPDHGRWQPAVTVELPEEHSIIC